ncbi:ABC transporter substrate-binding protein [Paracoccus versutus]|uniref:ABC transporter substrate-binding protein n=1 Tax=Paracoccus versutus TaxID=34007 RepID=UPI001FB8187C|nr:ABC transporter substrate-binding protein [Paracoccus versutus]MCJ1901379.1 ABC transporter substrate-binding protein [Paracoccus versutus]
MMKVNRKTTVAASLMMGGAMLALPSVAAAQDVSVYCSYPEEWCRVITDAYTEQTGGAIAMVIKSSGEVYAQLRAEASNPKGDVWYGGTGDPHLQAAHDDLLLEYRSPNMDKLQPWAIEQAKRADYKTVGIAQGLLGFIYNEEVLAANGLEPPQCWADLIKPEYKGEVQMPHPLSSGASYIALATIFQVFGEEEGFEYLKKLNENINQYTKSGGAPSQNAARGETAISVTTLVTAVPFIVDGFPLKVAAPCEGAGLEIPSMSIVKGGPNEEGAKAFYDWALTAEAQNALAEGARFYNVQSNVDAKLP